MISPAKKRSIRVLVDVRDDLIISNAALFLTIVLYTRHHRIGRRQVGHHWLAKVAVPQDSIVMARERTPIVVDKKFGPWTDRRCTERRFQFP